MRTLYLNERGEKNKKLCQYGFIKNGFRIWTSFITLGTKKKRFFGNYEIYYGSKAIKDSGNVDGLISGDTLRGKFKYRTYDGGVNIVPIIFLKQDDQITLGSGVAASFMNLVYFISEFPIEFDNSRFVFKKVSPLDLK